MDVVVVVVFVGQQHLEAGVGRDEARHDRLAGNVGRGAERR